MPKISIIILICILVVACSARAAVMSSPNYKIQEDSINIGGERQTSDHYIMEDTIGEVATGESTSTLYKLKAGYQQMQEVYLAISEAADVTMSPSIPSTGGTGNGSTSWTVTTDNVAGYSLSIKAGSSPALKSGSAYFSNYIPAVSGTPDYSWSIDATTSEFGFSPEGTNTAQKFLDNGSNTCNTGSTNSTDTCWYNLSTSDENIVSSLTANHPSGTATTVKFRAESGTSHTQTAGTYTATVTATAVAN